MTHATLSWTPAIGQLIDLALQEDASFGDLTTEAVGLSGHSCSGSILSRREAVVCGLPVAEWVLERAEPDLLLEPTAGEGQKVQPDDEVARLHGPVEGVLRVERTLLNFMMRLSGVATITRRYVEAVAGTGTRIVDTRKTLPGWRALDKYAVRVGGGANHRNDLGSGVLIKDNHIAAAGSVGTAVARARARSPHTLRVEVEVEDARAAVEAMEAGADVLLLDNMAPVHVQEVVELAGGRVLLEVSGGVNLDTVLAFAEAGADLISVGALTHSAPAADLSLELDRCTA